MLPLSLALVFGLNNVTKALGFLAFEPFWADGQKRNARDKIIALPPRSRASVAIGRGRAVELA